MSIHRPGTEEDEKLTKELMKGYEMDQTFLLEKKNLSKLLSALANYESSR